MASHDTNDLTFLILTQEILHGQPHTKVVHIPCSHLKRQMGVFTGFQTMLIYNSIIASISTRLVLRGELIKQFSRRIQFSTRYIIRYTPQIIEHRIFNILMVTYCLPHDRQLVLYQLLIIAFHNH